MKDLKIEPMKLIVSIVERGQGRNMIELFNGQRLTHHLQCAGKGTATSEIRDLLGLDGVEKDVIFTVGRGTMVNRVMRDLNNELRGAARSRGIVFDMKLTAMAHVTALAIQMNVQNEVGRVDTMTEEGMENSMILVTVNQGFTEEVMETARKAGARGGTILHARRVGFEDVENIFGFTIQPEKDIIMILTETGLRAEIMKNITEAVGINTEAKALLLSLPVDEISGI